MDKEYLEKFYEKSPRSPKGRISLGEFLANVENFFARQPLSDAVSGWDNILPELVKGIGEELAKNNNPSTEAEVVRQITDKFNGLGKLLSGEMGLPPDTRSISDVDLAGIVSELFAQRRGFFGGLALVGAMADIRSELTQKGIQEYIEGISTPPGWKDGWLELPQPDAEGFEYEPPYGEFLNYEEDRRRGVWKIGWEVFHEVGNGQFAGRKYSPNFGDFKFYPVRDTLGKINFTRNTIFSFDIEGKCQATQFDPRQSRRTLKSGKVISVPQPTHNIISRYYGELAGAVLGKKGMGSFRAMCHRVEHNLAQKRQLRIRRFEYGLKRPRLFPSMEIFCAQRAYSNYSSCFANLTAWMVQCGILKMGQYLQSADYFSSPPLRTEYVQVAVKNMGTHLLARIKWLDPPFSPCRLGARLFLLCGIKVMSVGKFNLARWSGPRNFRATNVFLTFEAPTAGAVEIPLLAPGMPLYDEEFYGLWQKGKVRGVDVYTQFYSVCQYYPDMAVVPSSVTSIMPHQRILFGPTPRMPKAIDLGKF